MLIDVRHKLLSGKRYFDRTSWSYLANNSSPARESNEHVEFPANRFAKQIRNVPTVYSSLILNDKRDIISEGK
jgi:hypothetical protein